MGVEPEQIDEETLRAAMAEGANVPTLLMVLVQLTGDRRWLAEPYRPSVGRGLSDNDSGGLSDDVQAEIREAAISAILAWRDGGPVAIVEPSEELLVEMLSAAMGEPVPVEYGPMIAAELAGGSSRPSGPASSPPAGFDVIVIGAGASGLCASVYLQQLGVEHTIIERNATVGGTWLENHYPGAGVDTPNHLYSFSFMTFDWSRYFALRNELHAYLEAVADRFDVRRRIRFDTEVTGAVFHEPSQRWHVTVRRPDGVIEMRSASVVISAAGIFNPPVIAPIPGLDRFEGSWFHTARWPEGLDLVDRRVAIIGNGASAMQIGPAIAPEVRALTLFQRSPQWAAPFEQFQRPVAPAVRALLRTVPLYRLWYRLRLGWTFNDRVYPSLQKDDEWAHPARSLNAINDGHRAFFTRHIESELGDRHDLLERVVPDYPPFGKRMLMDNGWFRMLTQEHVELVTDPIHEVRADRIVDGTGTEHEVDVIIVATGFDVIHFLTTYELHGRDGRTLQEAWDDDARAFLGLAVPGFPNFFCLYGPNTQPGHGGSLLFVIERQMHYVCDLLVQMWRNDLATVECRRDVHDDYNDGVDRAHEQMVWTHPGMETYYRNTKGRVVVNLPYRNVDLWHMTEHADLDDYVVAPRRATHSAVGVHQ